MSAGDNPRSAEDFFYGSVTVGERGQIVIPVEARNELGIKSGDKLLIMRHPVFGGLMVAKFESMNRHFNEFFREAERIAAKDGDTGVEE